MKHLLAAATAATIAFATAAWILREKPAARELGGSFAERFPGQASAFRKAAATDSRWQERRGHAFSLKEREESAPEEDPRWERILAGRPRRRPVPGFCLNCHAAVGTGGASYYEAAGRKPLGCEDCHDPASGVLRLTRAAPRAAAGYNDLRTLVCAQCHREYAAEAFPEGTTADAIEAFYGRTRYSDWTNTETGARVLEARHPQFEMFSQGIHARAGVSCADCHMPRERIGAMRVTAHNAGSPRANLERACGSCHTANEKELRTRIETIQGRTSGLMRRAKEALVAAIDAIGRTRASGASVDAALELQTKAQWRLDFVAADRSQGFHAPQEAARVLAEAIDYAHQAELATVQAQRWNAPYVGRR